MDRAIKEAERIHNELTQIERVISNTIADWNKFATTGDDAFLKAVAFDLHGFYTGLENIFNSIADTIDDHVPQGENWHKAVLSQMAQEIRCPKFPTISLSTRPLKKRTLISLGPISSACINPIVLRSFMSEFGS